MNITENGPASEESVHAIERRIGDLLPDEYRTWLLKTGGGAVEECPMPTIGGTGVLSWLFDPAFVEGNYLNGFAASYPAHYLAVGAGSGGSVCIRFGDGDRGAVYWASDDLANAILVDGEVSENIMLRIADGWEQFLSNW